MKPTIRGLEEYYHARTRGGMLMFNSSDRYEGQDPLLVDPVPDDPAEAQEFLERRTSVKEEVRKSRASDRPREMRRKQRRILAVLEVHR